MDEEEEIRARLNSLSGQINAGAAGALGNPIYKKEFPTSVSSNLFDVQSPGIPFEQLAGPGDLIEGKPSLYDRLFDLTERVDSQGNVIPGDIISTIRHSLADGDYRIKPYPDMSPIQRGAFNVQFTYGQDPVGELTNRIPFGSIFDLPFVDRIIPDFSEAVDYKFDPTVESIEIPEPTSLEFEPFKPATVDWPTRDDYRRDYNNHYEAGLREYGDVSKFEQPWFDSAPNPSLYDMSTYFGEDFFEKQSADNLQKSQEKNYLEEGIIDPWLAKEIELEEKNMRDLEAYNKRNEEEERLNREKYDKMVADMLAEEKGYYPEDMPPEEKSGFEKILDFISSPDFARDETWGEAAEITPPSWLTPELSTQNSETVPFPQSLLDEFRQYSKDLETAFYPQRGTFENPNLLTPDTQFNTNIPNPAIQN